MRQRGGEDDRDESIEDGGVGEVRVPRAPSALPSCRDTRRDEGVFRSGEAAALLPGKPPS